MTFRILCGDARETLATLPAASHHCCVTSPPYWGLRDYGAEGQIGLEPTPEEYVAKLVAVFREVRRVLRDDGTLWCNLGDSYAREPAKGGSGTPNGRNVSAMGYTGNKPIPSGLKQKDLVGIAWLVAFALRADGWYLRSDIIWAKPNPMPESVTDRPTKAHEYLFLLSKSERYYYDAEAVKEPISVSTTERWGADPQRKRPNGQPTDAFVAGGNTCGADPSGRNRRTVWTVATHPYTEAHFATFPPALVEPCIKAGTSERGVCPECGAPWERVTERTPMEVATSDKGAVKHGAGLRTSTSGTMTKAPTSRTVGWRPTCAHDAAPVPAMVLDPFNGAGTTGLVATRLQRRYTGIDVNPDYVAMAERRIRGDAPLFLGIA